MPSIIDSEFEKDPRRALLYKALSGEEDAAPLTPAAGAIQGVKSLLSGLMLRKLEGQYKERKDKYYQDSQSVIGALQPGAGPEEIARAFSASQNADLQQEGKELLLKSLMNRKAPTFGTSVNWDAENRPYVQSTSGETKYLEGVTRERERMVPLNVGNEYVFRGERTGQIDEGSGIPIQVSPSVQFTQDRQDARSQAAQDRQDRRSALSREGKAGRPEKQREFDYMMQQAGIEPGSEEYRKAAKIKLGLESRPGGFMEFLANQGGSQRVLGLSPRNPKGAHGLAAAIKRPRPPTSRQPFAWNRPWDPRRRALYGRG